MEPSKRFKAGVNMASLTLKNIPDDLFEQLKKTAHLHRRSLNNEILSCLEKALFADKIDAEEHLAAAQKLRRLTNGHMLTDEELTQLKNADRP